jgi:hypothetical protein
LLANKSLHGIHTCCRASYLHSTSIPSHATPPPANIVVFSDHLAKIASAWRFFPYSVLSVFACFLFFSPPKLFQQCREEAAHKELRRQAGLFTLLTHTSV